MSEGAYGKIDALKKVSTVRQVLCGNVFLNFQHLHPEFQMFILRHIQSHYVANSSLILVCFGRTQQLLSSTLSVFWGLVSAVLLSTSKTIYLRLLMLFIQSSRNGCSLIIIT